MGYLDVLDGILRPGVHLLGEGFAALECGWIERQELAGGGFRGRSGGDDLYYTDFALRAVDLIGPQSPLFATTAERMRHNLPAPLDVVSAFSILSCARTLSRHGHAISADQRHIRKLLARQTLPEGGFGVNKSSETSAYQTFLGTLCRQLLGDEAPVAADCDAIRRLQRESGGFAEREAGDVAQTNATAAAAAVLLMGSALQSDDAEGVTRFVASMQAEDGGLRAHAEARGGDLLSSFTALLTLCLLGAPAALELPALGRFVKGAVRPRGGFGASQHDPGADVEYTYYGIATLGLLRSLVEADC
ncbi:MAG: hypothetical protein GX131_15745 [candidate division WS1 bacterium]|nr:hypothetical protein [candidate division WS1 bacterium]